MDIPQLLTAIDQQMKKKKGKDAHRETAEDVILLLDSVELLLEKGYEELISLEHLDIEKKSWQINTAIKVLRDLRGSAILADEVGLGKTIEAGLLLKEWVVREQIHYALILVPAPLVYQWKNELQEKFHLSTHNLRDLRANGDMEPGIWLGSIQYFTRTPEIQKIVNQHVFDVLIIDEAHCLKNHQTATYKSVYKINRKNVLLLSATPIQNDIMELFNLVNILKPGYLKSRKHFRKEYVLDKHMIKNVSQLKQLLSDVLVRNKKSNTLTSLPNRKIHNHVIKPLQKEIDFYRATIRFSKSLFHKQQWHSDIDVLLLVQLLKQNSSSVHSVIETLRNKVMTRAQTNELRVQCRDLVASGESLKKEMPSKMGVVFNLLKQGGQWIIYTEYVETMHMVIRTLEQRGMRAKGFYGGMSDADKRKRVSEFKEHVFDILVSTESGGQGLNLQFCHQMINYDLPWNPMRIEQRIGRIHRFGQADEVVIHNLSSNSMIDEYILHILMTKIRLFQRVVGEMDTIMGAMYEQTSGDTSFRDQEMDRIHDQEEIDGIEIKIGKMILSEPEDTHQSPEESDRLIKEQILSWGDRLEEMGAYVELKEKENNDVFKHMGL